MVVGRGKGEGGAGDGMDCDFCGGDGRGHTKAEFFCQINFVTLNLYNQ